MALGNYAPGKQASFQLTPYFPVQGVAPIGGTGDFWRLKEFQLAMNGQIIDVTNLLSGGQKENAAGLQGAKITGKGPYDVKAMTMVVGNLYLFTMTLVSYNFTIAFVVPARVADINLSSSVEGVAEINISAESSGRWVPNIL